MRQTELLDAYAVASRPWRETSLLHRLVVRGRGFARVLQRGGRARRRGIRPLAPLTPLRVSWSGRGSLPTLTRFEIDAAAAAWRRPERQLHGLYVNELLHHLLPDDRYSEELYPLYRGVLERLEAGGDPSGALRAFELDLLQLAGHPVPLDRTEHGPVAPGGRYRYRPELGPVEADGAAEAGPAVRGTTLLALHRRAPMDAAARREARDLMRRLLDHHAAPRRFRTRDIMRALHKRA